MRYHRFQRYNYKIQNLCTVTVEIFMKGTIIAAKAVGVAASPTSK